MQGIWFCYNPAEILTPVESWIPDMAEPEKKRRAIQVDETNTQTCYANFCRVTGSPEELIIDFGMNSQPLNSEKQRGR